MGSGWVSRTSCAADSGPRIGIVAASGTGAQHLSCLLDDAGVAVSHVLGVGGRDLSGAVGAAGTRAALDALDADPGTDHIAVISKPADPRVAAVVRAHAATLSTPVSLLVIGPGEPDITSGAEGLIESVGGRPPAWRIWAPPGPAAAAGPGCLRGLYSGGTLADEAMIVLAGILGDVRSNIPLRPDLALPTSATHGTRSLAGLGHVVLDLGDDAFTAGRPHPMIDPTLRLSLLADQAADPDVAVVLLDVVLGHAADPDPAGSLAPAVRAAIATAQPAGRALAVVVALCGTAGDPQDRERQAAAPGRRRRVGVRVERGGGPGRGGVRPGGLGRGISSRRTRTPRPRNFGRPHAADGPPARRREPDPGDRPLPTSDSTC